MAGRLLPGMGQLLLAVAGFAMVVGWFVSVIISVYGQLSDGARSGPSGRLGEAGGVTFAAAWLWSLVTSLSILREGRANRNELDKESSGTNLREEN